MSTASETQTTAPTGRDSLKALEGLVLQDDWVVGRFLEKASDNTGGCFSEGYECVRKNGQRAFLKAVDLHGALEHQEFVLELNRLTDAVLCETQLLEKCKGMDRVVRALAFGDIKEIRGTKLQIPIPYIIFERADGTVRQVVSADRRPAHAWCLRALQHVATGIRQLHRERIAHQDLKLSNVLHFSGQSILKISDLGRSVAQGRPVHYDQFSWPGDFAHAPPEAVYGFTPMEFNVRRLSADLYLLSSFACGLIAGVPLNALLYARVAPDFRPELYRGSYTGTFENAKPHLVEAFVRVLDEIGGHIHADAPYRLDLLRFISEWGQPDPRDRGHPTTRAYNQEKGNIFDLERYLSPLENMRSHAMQFERRSQQR